MELGYARTDLRRRLVDAVLRGDKTATAGLYDKDEPLPPVGVRSLLLDYDDRPVGVVETTEVRVLRAGDVDLAFARDEGEGFETVAEWREAHERFWADRTIDDDTPIVAERFRLVEQLPRKLATRGLGLGLAALGRPGYINLGHAHDRGDTNPAVMERHAHEVLDAAYAGGIRYFDAARSYGRAEEFLAHWLERCGIAPGEVEVGSKWGYTYTAGWRVDAKQHEVKDLSVATLRRQLKETRALLGDHLQLYQIHSATLESGVLEDDAVQDELARLRADGLAVGLTATGPGQRATIERALETGALDAVQATWNLLERTAAPALAAAHDAGLAVIVKEALANGRLTDRGDVPELIAAARERGTTPDALALAAALAQPWADIVLSGAATIETLESNLRARDVEYDERLASIAEDPEAYWSTRAALPWN
jgi:aryl-alcohol dehydrogenase-like predicted oxidoreductase